MQPARRASAVLGTLGVLGCTWLGAPAPAASQARPRSVGLEMAAGAELDTGIGAAVNGVGPGVAAGLSYAFTEAWRARILGSYAYLDSAQAPHSPSLSAEIEYLLDDLTVPPFLGVGIRQPFPRPRIPLTLTSGYLLFGAMFRLSSAWRISTEIRFGTAFAEGGITSQLLARVTWVIGGLRAETDVMP